MHQYNVVEANSPHEKNSLPLVSERSTVLKSPCAALSE